MKAMRACAAGLLLLAVSPSLLASGPLGIAAIIERVEFEPSAEAPERVQVFGAFAFYDGMTVQAETHASPRAGYMYFKLPTDGNTAQIIREWKDLASVAGTGEAVAFGRYGYIGQFEDLSMTGRSAPGTNAYVLERGISGTGRFAVHPESREPGMAVEYQIGEVGVVRLGEGNHEALVADLEAALGR